MRRLALALATIILLAGCTESPAAAPSPEATLGDTPAPVVREIETGPDVGAISGVVVDETIAPIAGATVLLLQTGATTETDEGGAFVFEDLEPGLYGMAASAPGHLDVQATAQVAAGEVVKPKVIMAKDLAPEPYHQTYQHHGFAELYLGLGSFILAAANTGDCDCAIHVTPGADAKTFVLDAYGDVWAQDPSGAGALYWEILNEDGYDTSSLYPEDLVIVSGFAQDFPIHAHAQRETWTNESTTWTARVTGGTWIHPQLEYDMFLTVFYREKAPDGWTIEDL